MNKNVIAVLLLAAAAIIIGLLMVNPFKNKSVQTASVVAGLTEGTHYRVLSSPLSQNTDGVTVQEFFWYGCPHCQAFEPELNQWRKNTASDVVVELNPVAWNDSTALHAAMYQAGLNSTDPEALHTELFDLIIGMRQERNPARQIELASPVFAKYGIAADTLPGVLESPEVRSAVDNFEKQMRKAEVSSTPSLLVGGRYMVLNNDAVADKGIFTVVEGLIEQVRQDNR